ncbi:MAG TPA: hypothetical protein VGA72_09095 [Anaerolineales bacterium]
MQHPLEFIPAEYRKRIFFTLLALTLSLFAVFRVLDQPLQTPAAPNGIVSFEFAGNAQTARVITDSWKQMSLLLSSVAGRPNPDIVNVSYVFAAFGLGLDYLFMPIYSFALAFGTLYAMGRHAGWFRSLGAVAGYGAFAAALFDAAENYALFQILLNKIYSPYPEIAYYCASLKFVLLIFGLLYILSGWLLPKK